MVTEINDMDWLSYVEQFRQWHGHHVEIIDRLSTIHEPQLVPYCQLLIERIKNQVLMVLEDGIEAAILLHHGAGSFLPSTVQSLLNHLEAALGLPSLQGDD